MSFRRSFTFCLGLFLLSLAAPPARAEHDLPAEPEAEAPEATTRKATSILTVQPRVESAPNVRTIRDIQEVISQTDPNTLEALKEALLEIAEGREVSGEAGQAAMDFLSRIPDQPGEGEPVEPEAAQAESEKSELPAVTNADRIQEKGAADPKAEGPAIAGVSVPGAAIVKWEVPPRLSAGQVPSITKAAEAAGSATSLFRGFPYGPAKDADGEDAEDGTAQNETTAEAKQRRKARLAALGGVGGEELPSGQGGYASGRTAGGGYGGTVTLNTSSAAAKVPQEKQRLAGAVTSLLARFKSRAMASPGKAGRPGIFERLALRGGLTPERALATAEKSPVFRKFQAAASEAGMTPTESLGAYYTVLGLAWASTLAFLFYCLRHSPLLAVIRRKKD